jgi:hypothetical protein
MVERNIYRKNMEQPLKKGKQTNPGFQINGVFFPAKPIL